MYAQKELVLKTSRITKMHQERTGRDIGSPSKSLGGKVLSLVALKLTNIKLRT